MAGGRKKGARGQGLGAREEKKREERKSAYGNAAISRFVRLNASGAGHWYVAGDLVSAG